MVFSLKFSWILFINALEGIVLALQFFSQSVRFETPLWSRFLQLGLGLITGVVTEVFELCNVKVFNIVDFLYEVFRTMPENGILSRRLVLYMLSMLIGLLLFIVCLIDSIICCFFNVTTTFPDPGPSRALCLHQGCAYQIKL